MSSSITRYVDWNVDSFLHLGHVTSELFIQNARLLSQFVNPHTGHIMGRQKTGLCIYMQRRITGLINLSRYAGEELEIEFKLQFVTLHIPYLFNMILFQDTWHTTRSIQPTWLIRNCLILSEVLSVSARKFLILFVCIFVWILKNIGIKNNIIYFLENFLVIALTHRIWKIKNNIR